MELLLGLYHLSPARPQLCSQVRGIQGTSSLWLSPSACSLANWDHATQASLYGLKPLVSNELSNKLQRKSGTELLILFTGSSTEHMTNDLRRTGRSLGTRAPPRRYATGRGATHACLARRHFRPLARPNFNRFLCCRRAGKQQRHAGGTRTARAARQSRWSSPSSAPRAAASPDAGSRLRCGFQLRKQTWCTVCKPSRSPGYFYGGFLYLLLIEMSIRKGQEQGWFLVQKELMCKTKIWEKLTTFCEVQDKPRRPAAK